MNSRFYMVPVLCAVVAAHSPASTPESIVNGMKSGRLADKEAALAAFEKLDKTAMGDVAPSLAGLMEEGDWGTQCYAGKALLLSGAAAKPVVPRIRAVAMKAMGEKRQSLAMLAFRTMNGVDPEAAAGMASELGGYLKSPDFGTVFVACSALQGAGPSGKAAVPELMKLLDSSDPYIPVLAARALSGIGPDAGSAVPVLAGLMKKPNRPLARASAKALSVMGPATVAVVPQLLAALKSDDSELVRYAVTAIGSAGPQAKAAIPDLIVCLKSSDQELVRRALKSLSAMGKVVVPDMITAVKANDRIIGPKAAEILGNLGPDAKEAVPVLVAALKSPEPGVIAASAVALPLIDRTSEKQAVMALLEGVKKGNMDVAVLCAEMVVRVSTKVTDPDVKDAIAMGLAVLLKRGNEDAQKKVATLLGSMGPSAKAAAPALREGVFSSAVYKDEAAAALKKIEPGKAVTSTPTIDSIEADTSSKGAILDL